MKHQASPKGPVTKPLLQDLVNRTQTKSKQNAAVPAVEKSPVKKPGQPALYQDAGGAYSSDFTFPQE